MRFTCRRLILSSSSHSRPSSTSMAFLITVAISFIFSMCACISCNINTVNAYLSPSTRVNLSKSVCGTDVSVLFSELGDYSRIIFLAGHQKAKHLLSVFAHDQLQCRLMLLQRCSQLCRETREDLDTTLKLSVANHPNTPLFSCCSSRICRFSCWIPMTRVERGRCLATWFNTSISSWY